MPIFLSGASLPSLSLYFPFVFYLETDPTSILSSSSSLASRKRDIRQRARTEALFSASKYYSKAVFAIYILCSKLWQMLSLEVFELLSFSTPVPIAAAAVLCGGGSKIRSPAMRRRLRKDGGGDADRIGGGRNSSRVDD